GRSPPRIIGLVNTGRSHRVILDRTTTSLRATSRARAIARITSRTTARTKGATDGMRATSKIRATDRISARTIGRIRGVTARMRATSRADGMGRTRGTENDARGLDKVVEPTFDSPATWQCTKPLA